MNGLFKCEYKRIGSYLVACDYIMLTLYSPYGVYEFKYNDFTEAKETFYNNYKPEEGGDFKLPLYEDN